MAVTSQQIAELAGVSRGTVDRALHNRGRVNPDVAARIHQIAQELGYKPNIIGQALVRTKRDFRLGAILQSSETPTMQIVAEGVRQSAAALRGSGVELELREIVGLDAGRLLEEIDSLVEKGVRGLAIAPNNAPEIALRIDELAERGIPVVTLNSDVPSSRRLCFIGMDNYRAGQTAAYLMTQCHPTGGQVFPLAGHLNNTAHNSRLNGFADALRTAGSETIQLLPPQPCFDREDHAYEIAQHILRENPGLSGIYVASNGQQGVCRAIDEAGLRGKVCVIAYDLNAPNMELLKDGSLTFVLDQEAFEQGFRPPQILYDRLLYQKMPEKELLYTDILIRTRYNSDLPETLTDQLDPEPGNAKKSGTS